MTKNFIRSVLFFLSCVWIFACAPQDTASPPAQETRQSAEVALVRAQDFAPGQLDIHYQKHGYQFGTITREEYLEQARSLLNAPAGKDVLEKKRANGDVLHYRVSTGEFAVMTAHGRIRTYFKTDQRYWMRQ